MRRRINDAKDRTKNRVKTRVKRHVEEGSTIGTSRQLVSRGVVAAQTLTKGIVDESLWLPEASTTYIQPDSSDISSVSPFTVAANRVQLYLGSASESSEGEIVSVKQFAAMRSAKEVSVYGDGEVENPERTEIAKTTKAESIESTSVVEPTSPAIDPAEPTGPTIDPVEPTDPAIDQANPSSPASDPANPTNPPKPPQSISDTSKTSISLLEDLIQELDFKLQDQTQDTEPANSPPSPPILPQLPREILAAAQKSEAPTNPRSDANWAHRKLNKGVEVAAEVQHRVYDRLHDRVHDKVAAISERALCLFPNPSSSVGTDNADTALDDSIDGTSGNSPGAGGVAIGSDCAGSASRRGSKAGVDDNLNGDYKSKYLDPASGSRGGSRGGSPVGSPGGSPVGPPVGVLAKTGVMLSQWEMEFGCNSEYTPAPEPTREMPVSCTPHKWGHEKVKYYGFM